jgi:hypothetical protein
MSRTVRATIATLFGYARFGAAFAIGLALVPFTLHHVGATMYGYWLASGELMAYAALTEFGVLVTLPGGRRGRRPRRSRSHPRAQTTGAGAAQRRRLPARLGSPVFAPPRVLHIGPEQRSAVTASVLVVALLGAVAHLLRVFGCARRPEDAWALGVVDFADAAARPRADGRSRCRDRGWRSLRPPPQVLAGFCNLLRVRSCRGRLAPPRSGAGSGGSTSRAEAARGYGLVGG